VSLTNCREVRFRTGSKEIRHFLRGRFSGLLDLFHRLNARTVKQGLLRSHGGLFLHFRKLGYPVICSVLLSINSDDHSMVSSCAW
jgi:hypothetical protein